MDLDIKYRWIARDKDGDLYAYEEKPVKSSVDDTWFESEEHALGGIFIADRDNEYSSIKWEDNEPYDRLSEKLSEKMIVNEDIQFLKDLQEELNTQENDYQASPIFWVVRQYEKRIIHEDFADGYVYFHNDGESIEFETIEELREFVKESYECYDNLSDIIDLTENEDDLYSIFETITSYFNENGYFGFYPIEKIPVIQPNTMFLTKQEAKDHIESNYYHYNDTVHTYAMTAWRAPKVERLLDILHRFDWESLEGK